MLIGDLDSPYIAARKLHVQDKDEQMKRPKLAQAGSDGHYIKSLRVPLRASLVGHQRTQRALLQHAIKRAGHADLAATSILRAVYLI